MQLLFEPRKHPIWHPCSQMKDYEQFPPVRIARADGSLIYDEQGKPIIDAISSWWCKPLGHKHPRLHAALLRQSEHFEHVILANTTNTLLETLSEKILTLIPALGKVFYTGDGSSAIEIALKMSLQYHAQTIGPGRRTRFAHLTHGYHGENLLSLSVSDLGLYKAPFAPLCPQNVCLSEHRMLSGTEDPQWNHLDANEWVRWEEQLEDVKDELAGIIIEPVLQGAGGMRPYSPELVKKLRAWTTTHGIHLIADEVMTGLGRTGKAFAMMHAGNDVTADIVVLMKGLSAGYIPFSAVLTHNDLYETFYADWEQKQAFIHSNTYSGNALGAAVALEALRIYEEEGWFERVARESHQLRHVLETVAAKTGALTKIRHLGWVAAADLVPPKNSTLTRPAYRVYQECLRRGALIRPLGETLYLLPPFNIPAQMLESLTTILIDSIKSVFDTSA